MHAVVCAAQASAAPNPMKQFYRALELQWVCLAQQAEREAVTSQQGEIAAAESDEQGCVEKLFERFQSALGAYEFRQLRPGNALGVRSNAKFAHHTTGDGPNKGFPLRG